MPGRRPCPTIAPMSLTAPLLPAAQALGTGASEIIVAYASGPADIPQAWDGLQLPHLQALLATLAPTTLIGVSWARSPPVIDSHRAPTFDGMSANAFTESTMIWPV